MSSAEIRKCRSPATPARRAWQRFLRNRSATCAAGFLALVVILTWVLPWMRTSTITHVLPKAMNFQPNEFVAEPFQPPDSTHWFGTDAHGRDLLSRVVYGARISMLVAALGGMVSLVLGVCWGAVAGYAGGRWDNTMMRLVDILYSLPSIVFVIVVITTLEELLQGWLSKFISGEAGSVTRLLHLFAGLGAVSWLTMARIVRGQVLSLKNRAFVEASRALGASHARILFRHILPNLSGVILVYLALMIPSIILYESFLSYLGLGIRPPQASLGSLLAEGAGQINPIRIYWWMVVFPGAALASTLLALNFVADGLRDAFEPRRP